MTSSPALLKTTHWLTFQNTPAQEQVKMGSAHRAQPFSHHNDKYVAQQFFRANWVAEPYKERVGKYKTLRAERVRRRGWQDTKLFTPYESKTYFDGGNGSAPDPELWAQTTDNPWAGRKIKRKGKQGTACSAYSYTGGACAAPTNVAPPGACAAICSSGRGGGDSGGGGCVGGSRGGGGCGGGCGGGS
jgi:hypothetical protein